MEKEIIRITIKGSSGYCSYEYVYEDRLSLTSDSISYEFVPALNSHIRKPRKWSYKSNNPEFKKSFKAIAEGVKEALVNETIAFCTDVAESNLLYPMTTDRETDVSSGVQQKISKSCLR